MRQRASRAAALAVAGSVIGALAAPTSASAAATPVNVARASGVVVSASSQDVSTTQVASKAIDGLATGYPSDYTREWATLRGGAGSWIDLTWPRPVTIDRVVLYDRPNTSDQITAGRLTFSDGSSISTAALTNSGSGTTVRFTGRTVSSLRFAVTSVSSSTSNVGLAEIEVYGAEAVAANTAPVADAGTAQSVVSGSTVTLDGSASTDADNDALTYTWTQVSGPSITLNNATTSKPSFQPTVAGTYVFSLTANDGTATSQPDTVTITVTAPATTPEPVTLPAGVSLRTIDGGDDYFDQYPLARGLDDVFPIGVWFESVTGPEDIAIDKANGINTYVQLTSGSDLALIRQNGMYAFTDFATSASTGLMLSDETDMWAGPGDGAWNPGGSCVAGDCGYTVQTTLLQGVPDDTLVYSNYGKGVLFWETDAQASRFVNDFQDVVSVDGYWFTDPNICSAWEGGNLLAAGRALSDSRCRNAANYGANVDRVRALVNPVGSKPVWNFVEVGHPASEDWAPTITGPQIRAAVWSSIIHGARGIIYFNHNFGGTCQSQHVLRDDCGATVRPAVATLNSQINQLAPVLNSATLDGALTVSAGVDATVKAYDGALYVIAGASNATSKVATFTLTCASGGTATVINEGRSLPVVAGSFRDTFTDGNAVHIYRIDAGCGL